MELAAIAPFRTRLSSEPYLTLIRDAVMESCGADVPIESIPRVITTVIDAAMRDPLRQMDDVLVLRQTVEAIVSDYLYYVADATRYAKLQQANLTTFMDVRYDMKSIKQSPRNCTVVFNIL